MKHIAWLIGVMLAGCQVVPQHECLPAALQIQRMIPAEEHPRILIAQVIHHDRLIGHAMVYFRFADEDWIWDDSQGSRVVYPSLRKDDALALSRAALPFPVVSARFEGR